LVAFALSGGNPAKMRAGKEKKLPPPATLLSVLAIPLALKSRTAEENVSVVMVQIN
jgi:hypothetical protein